MNLLQWMRIAWPAFLVAGLQVMVVFAMIDPQDMHWFFSHAPLSRQAAYTMAFFVFWIFAMLSSALTLMLARPANEVNQAPPADA